MEAAGVDTLHVAQANHTGNMGDTIPAMGTQPYGFMVSYSKKIKEIVSIPVSVVGRIVTPEAAEAVLTSGSADIIALVVLCLQILILLISVQITTLVVSEHV